MRQPSEASGDGQMVLAGFAKRQERLYAIYRPDGRMIERFRRHPGPLVVMMVPVEMTGMLAMVTPDGRAYRAI